MHPDFDSPEHHQSRSQTRSDFVTLDRILALNALEVARDRARTAASPAAHPAERPACNPTSNAGEGTVAAAPSSVPPKPGLAPLRRVVGYVDHHPLSGRDVTVRHELLECGHHAPPKQDAFGETNAYRRRCRQCLVVGRVNGRAF